MVDIDSLSSSALWGLVTVDIMFDIDRGCVVDLVWDSVIWFHSVFSMFSVFFYNGGLGESHAAKKLDWSNLGHLDAWISQGWLIFAEAAPVGELPHPGMDETHKG